MTAIESKEEISDTDSGIILHSGPESPTSPVKDTSTHTRALKVKHQSLEGRLELCLLELRKLCIREAELTGKLSSDYPLMPDEIPPQVRMRIGASFKIDEGLIYLEKEDSELNGLETELALQRQIFQAARKLSLEDKLSKPQKKSRAQQCKRQEKKVRQLQEAVFQCRIRSQCSSPTVGDAGPKSKDLNISDDSSLSDVVAMDEDVDLLDTVSTSVTCLAECERSPIQNTPWKESSLDQPYHKPVKPQPVGSGKGSGGKAVTQVQADFDRIPLSHFIKNSALRQSHSASAPSTPELHVRRQYSQSFRFAKRRPCADKETLSSESLRTRTRLPQRRCAADFLSLSPESVGGCERSARSLAPTEIPKLSPPPYGFRSPTPQKAKVPPPYTRVARTPSLNVYPQRPATPRRDVVSEELKSWHQRSQSHDLALGLTELQGTLGVKSPTLPPFHQGSGNVILQRADDGTPLQWFVPEDHEIVSQV
ncbi:innate immunity activator protein [Stigmatopora nigra]